MRGLPRVPKRLAGMVAASTALLLAACPTAQADGLFKVRTGEVTGIAALPDGSFLTSLLYSVARVYPDGRIARVAGTGSPGLPTDGARATATMLYDAGKVALAADGSVLIALGYACTPCSFVARVAPDGTISKVAGTPELPASPPPDFHPVTYFEDGSPAVEAHLIHSWMEPTSDGGFLIANGDQLDRVDPAGSIWKVPAESGFPGIVDIASLSDGGFALTAGNYVMRLDGGGSIRTIAGSSDEAGFGGDGGPARRAALSAPTGIEPTSHGGLVIADTGNDRVRLIDRNGDIRTLVGGGPTEWCDARNGYFRGDGRGPRRAALCGPVDMVRDPMGGWLIAHEYGVSFLASPDTRRMGVSITRPEADRGRLTFVATTAGSATVEVRRRGRTVATRTVQVSAGPNSVPLPRRPAGVHTFNLRAENADSADGDNIRLLLGGRLPLPLGEALIERTIDGGASRPPKDRARAADGPYEYLDRCRQFGSRRVDCVVIDQVIGGCSVSYLRLRPTGLLRRGSYRCRSGRRFREQLPRGAETYPFPL